MSKRNCFALMAILAMAVTLAACSGSDSGGSGTSATSYQTGWMDTNSDGIYDPYQDSTLWSEMSAAVAAQGGGTAPGWVDADGDGICDYAGDPNLWGGANQGDWIDENGDGICDNYPDRPQDGTGKGWKGGWQ